VDNPVYNYIKPAYLPVDKPLFPIKPGYPNLWLWGFLAYPKNKVLYIGLYVIGVMGFLLTSPEIFDMLGT
jgi:hypothetical protein